LKLKEHIEFFRRDNLTQWAKSQKKQSIGVPN